MLIKPMNLGTDAFFLKYRKVDENWLMLHAHQGIELLYIHEGTGTVTLERKEYALRPNTLFCFQPFQLHKVVVPVKAGSSYIRSNLTFDPHMVEPYLQSFPKLNSFLRRLTKGILKQQVFTISEDQIFDRLLRSYDKLQALPEGEHHGPEDQALFLITVLKHLQLHVFDRDTSQVFYEKTLSHVERALDWIESHFREPFSLETLSQELHLSPYYISHLFKRHMGMTLSDYVTGHRIREACVLLANTDYSIVEIGRRVGGFSAPYFSQLFKKHKGVTPKAYREAIRHGL